MGNILKKKHIKIISNKNNLYCDDSKNLISNKVCLNWLKTGGSTFWLKGDSNKYKKNKNSNDSIVENYAEQFWIVSNYSNYKNISYAFTTKLSPNIGMGSNGIFLKKKGQLAYKDSINTYFRNKLETYIFNKNVFDYQDSYKKKVLGSNYFLKIKSVSFKKLAISENNRNLKRKYFASEFLYEGNKLKKKFNLKFKNFLDIGKRKIFKLKKIEEKNFSIKRYWNFFYRNAQKVYFKSLIKIGFPAIDYVKKNHQILILKKNKYSKRIEFVISNQYARHPSTVLNQTKKYLAITTSFNSFNYWNINKKLKSSIYEKYYNIIWRYFKFQVEKFFYNQIGIRMHIWFLNIWDIFIGGLDSQWQWFRYENSTIRFLTRRGQRFLIETREQAKYFVRAMALTLTMVGGAKFFMDKVSSMLKFHRNNWAFILHITKSLRFCINFFWFRFFINYKVSLQGKIGGFLRAAKKVYKKGKITIEDRSSVITYYRGFPVTRFGVYNLSLWIQYRIPSLIGKFEGLEYIDTMKILLGTYSVPWLAERLASIVDAILQDKVYKKDVKVAQYDRRVRARHRLYIEVKKKNNIIFKKNIEKLYNNENTQKNDKIFSILEKLNILIYQKN